jgi:hypothetical protein
MEEGTSGEDVAIQFLSQYLDRPIEEIAIMQITVDLAHLINAIVCQAVSESQNEAPEGTTWH